MNIKISKNGKETYNVEFPDECREDIVDIIDKLNKSDENKVALCKELFVGAIGIIGALGLGKLVNSMIENDESERQINEKQLSNIIRAISYNYENSEQLFDDALISIKEMEEGKISNFEVVGIKVKGYNPETKLFSIAA